MALDFTALKAAGAGLSERIEWQNGRRASRRPFRFEGAPLPSEPPRQEIEALLASKISRSALASRPLVSIGIPLRAN